MALVDASAHSEYGPLIRWDIWIRSVERSTKWDNFRKNAKGIPMVPI